MTLQRVLWLAALIFTVWVVVPFPIAKAQESPSLLGEASKQGAMITFKEGRLSVTSQDRPLKWVLEEISREARVAIVMVDGVGGAPTSVQFENLPLEAALRQLLKDYDAFFFYGVEKKPPATLSAVWIYRRGQGRGLAPIPPEAWASTKEVEGMLTDPDPEVRSRAVDALVKRKGNKALPSLLSGLRDGNDSVRMQVLYQALSRGVELPANSLRELMLTDPSPDVRFLALDHLAKHPDVRSIAERALNDPSPHVQNKAREILDRLDAAVLPKASQPPQGQSRPQNQ